MNESDLNAAHGCARSTCSGGETILPVDISAYSIALIMNRLLYDELTLSSHHLHVYLSHHTCNTCTCKFSGSSENLSLVSGLDSTDSTDSLSPD